MRGPAVLLDKSSILRHWPLTGHCGQIGGLESDMTDMAAKDLRQKIDQYESLKMKALAALRKA